MNVLEKWNLRVQEIMSTKHAKSGAFRKGQVWMNALYDVDPFLRQTMVASDLDCFYDDSKCDAFLEKLKSVCSTEEEKKKDPWADLDKPEFLEHFKSEASEEFLTKVWEELNNSYSRGYDQAKED